MRVINPKGARAPEILDGMTWELIPGVGRVSPEITEAQATRYASLGFSPYKGATPEPEETPASEKPPPVPATIAPRPPPKPAPSRPKTASKNAKKKKSTRRGR